MKNYTIRTYSQRQKDSIVKILLDAGMELYKGFSGYKREKTIAGNRREHSFKDGCEVIVFDDSGYIANMDYPLGEYYLKNHINLDSKENWTHYDVSNGGRIN